MAPVLVLYHYSAEGHRKCVSHPAQAHGWSKGDNTFCILEAGGAEVATQESDNFGVAQA